MENNEILEILNTNKKLLPDFINVEANLENDFIELGINSLEKIQLAIEIEKVFDINISDEEIENSLSINDLIEVIKNKK
jgi:acyl carrier protein